MYSGLVTLDSEGGVRVGVTVTVTVTVTVRWSQIRAIA